MADEEAARKLRAHRHRAEELREVAAGVRNLDAKETLLRLAAAYDHMADMLERLPDEAFMAGLREQDSDTGRPPKD